MNHTTNQVPLYSLDKHWKPIPAKRAQHYYRASTLKNQCKRNLNYLNNLVMHRSPLPQGVAARDFLMKFAVQQARTHTAALFTHIERRDVVISKLKKKVAEPDRTLTSSKRAISVTSMSSMASEEDEDDGDETCLPDVQTTMREESPYLEESVAMPQEDNHAESQDGAVQQIDAQRLLLRQAVISLQHGHGEQEAQLQQSKEALARLEKALHSIEEKLHPRLRKVKSMQTRLESNSQTLASRDEELAAARELVREKSLEVKEVRNHSDQMYKNDSLFVDHLEKEKDDQLEELQTYLDQEARTSGLLKDTLKQRDKDVETLTNAVAEKDRELEVLWRRIYRLQDGAIGRESKK